MNQPANPEANAAVTRDLVLTTPNLVAAGESSSVFHKAQTYTRIHDVQPGAGTHVIGIYAGKKEVNLAPGQTWADALAGAVVPPQQSITAIVQNTTDAPRIPSVTLVVEEQAVVLPADAPAPGTAPAAPVPQKQFGFGAERPKTVSQGNAPANTPFVRRTGSAPVSPAGQAKQTEDVVQNADGSQRKVVRTVLPPIAQRSPEVAAQIRAAGGNPNVRSGGGAQSRGNAGTSAARRAPTVRASGKAPARVNPPKFHGAAEASPRSTSGIEASGRTRIIRGGGVAAPGNVSPSGMPRGNAAPASRTPSSATQGSARTVVVMPADGEFTAALIVGHAERLLLRVESNVALPKMFKPSLTRALASANGQPRRAGGNDVVICVSHADLIVLRQLVVAGGLALDAETRDRLARVIRRGLAVVRGEMEPSTTNVATLAAVAPAPTEELSAAVAAVTEEEEPAIETAGA